MGGVGLAEALANRRVLGGPNYLGVLAPSVVAYGTVVLLVPLLVKVPLFGGNVFVVVVGLAPSELVECW